MPKRIISSGHNIALLRVRNSMIEQAGYAVVTSKEAALVLELVQKQKFDGAVLCNSIPLHLRMSLCKELRKLKPTLPLVILYSDGEEQNLRECADQLVPSMHGVAQPLIEA